MTDEVNPQQVPSAVRTRQKKLLAWVAGIVLGFYAIMGVGAAALAWRLSQGPWDAKVLLPAIEAVMSQGERLTFDIGSLTLSWKGRENPLAMEMRDISLLGPRGEFLTIGHADLGLSPWRLLLAQLHFNYAKIENLSMRIIRLPDGALTLTGAENGAGKARARSVKLELRNIVNDLPAIDHLSLANMRVIFEDQKEALIRRFDDVDMEMDQSQGFGGRSVSGFLTSTLTGINDGSLAAVDFIYDAAGRELTAVARLDNTDTRKLIGGILRAANLPLIDMMVEGRAEMRLRNDFSMESMTLQLQGEDGMLHWPRNYGEGLTSEKLTHFDLHVGFDPKTQTVQLLNAGITLKGIGISAKGLLALDETRDRLEGNIRVNIPVVAVDVLPAVWPKVWDSGGREWLVDQMDKGRFTRIDVDIPLTAKREIVPLDESEIDLAAEEAESELEPETRWNIETGSIKGTFGFTGVTVDYRNPLQPAQNTTGTGVFEGLGLTLDIEKAQIGGLNVSKGELLFDDLITPGKGHAHLHFVMSGSVGAVFDYLEREPIAYRKKVDLDASKAQGRANVDVLIDFPTLKDMRVEDVHVKANAKLSDLVVPGAVKGLTLSGPAFDLEASENHFKLSGSGSLEGQPATIMWHELFSTTPQDEFSSKLEAEIATNKAIREKFIGSLESRVDGVIPATISLVTRPNGKSALNVTAKLDAASVDFTNPFNAVKEKGKPATAKLNGTLQDGYIESIDSLTISGSGMSLASGSVGFGRDANKEPILAKVLLKGLKLGENNLDLDATWPSENDVKAEVTGASLDARWIMGSAPDPSNPNKPKTHTGYDIRMKLDRLFVGNLPLEKVTASFVGNTGGVIRLATMDAAAAGAPITLRYSATGGEGDRMLLESSDAGAALAALGITERVRGGTLRVDGMPRKDGQAGDMQGRLVIEKFSVYKAPVLAKLINLLSLPGILNLLEQDTGLRFERAESGITWLNQPGGGKLFFAEGRTSGASLGLTFEGEVDTASDTMDVQGTVIPMSEVNSLISQIPLLGDILTGGAKGSGIFAATYKMRGSTADPDVTINPLSVLTPGILRRILFEGAGSKAPAAKP